tara:strand:- start:985 stop:1581 length:597 start_codon:yes stop_codon:yes gene_type:complete
VNKYNKKIDPREIFLRGKKINLKILTELDVLESDWYGWFNDENICLNLEKHYFPNTINQQLEYLKNEILPSQNKLQLGITESKDSKIIGIISLNDINYINRSSSLSTILPYIKNKNLSIFLEVNHLIFKHAFFSLNLNKIYGGSLSKDVSNLMCRTLGFKFEGTHYDHVFKNGKYVNTYNFGLLKKDYLKLIKNIESN